MSTDRVINVMGPGTPSEERDFKEMVVVQTMPYINEIRDMTLDQLIEAFHMTSDENKMRAICAVSLLKYHKHPNQKIDLGNPEGGVPLTEDLIRRGGSFTIEFAPTTWIKPGGFLTAIRAKEHKFQPGQTITITDSHLGVAYVTCPEEEGFPPCLMNFSELAKLRVTKVH